MSGNAQYISVIAPKYWLPAPLVAAIVQVESSGNRFAHRCEPDYPYLWDVRAKAPFRTTHEMAAARLPPHDFPSPIGISPATEWLDQQSSWGLMQVMGAVAREQGFTGPLPGLSDPLMGLNHGCKLLAWHRDRYLKPFGWAGVIASYNSGTPEEVSHGVFRNQSYVDAVRKAGGADINAIFTQPSVSR